jgi:xylulokinase
VILTIDLGTSVTKAALWDRTGLVALAGAPLDTAHPAPGWAEQDPSAWWGSVVDACAQVREGAPDGFASVEVVGCTGARQTFAMVDGAGVPLGPGIVWSDRRASAEAAVLAADGGSAPGPAPLTTVPVDAASVAAKLAWLATHQRRRLDASAWILTPRDLVVWRLTGEVATDPTMASRSGLYDADGEVVDALVGPAAARRLPPVVPSDRVTGGLTAPSAAALGLTEGTPVVIGAGDRACEVLGSGASDQCPMVSWGTTANVSMPVEARPEPPPGAMLSRAAGHGWLIECGLSAAGSFVDWLGALTSSTSAELATRALRSPPGARGVVATPWLDGARAPWWRPEAGAAFVGLTSAHGPDDLARAIFESVAWEVRRCLETIASRRTPGVAVVELALGGAGAAIPVWIDVLTGVTGLPVRRRRSGQAACAGAALLAAGAVGIECQLDRLDPVDRRVDPDPSVADQYAALSTHAERTAVAVVELDRWPAPTLSDRPSDPPLTPGRQACT